jgi:DHA3 family macrolide efflux protein-like MFS transporter
MGGTLRLLRDRPFRRFWLAGALAATGGGAGRFALLLYVARQGGGVGAVALLVALETLPGVIAGPLAGTVVDGAPRRALLAACYVGRALFAVAILVHPAGWVIYGMVVMHSLAAAVSQPARLASVPLLVKGEDLPRANGMEESVSQVAVLLGPALGAALLLHGGLAAALAAEALAFGAAAALLAGLRLSAERGADEALSARAAAGEIVQGWRYLVRHPFALRMNVLHFVALACTGVWVPLAPFFVADRLGGAEALVAWQLSALGLGAAAGGLLVSGVVARWGKGVVLVAALLAEGALLAVYAVVADAAISTGVIFIWGITVTMSGAPFAAILQERVEERYLGRLFAAVKQNEALATLLAAGAAGLLHPHLTAEAILLLAGFTYVIAIAGLSSGPRGRVLLRIR